MELQGAAKAGLVSTLNSYVRSYGVKITVFLEIKISENRADKVIKCPGLKGHMVSKLRGS